jgi:hypothetical protein
LQRIFHKANQADCGPDGVTSHFNFTMTLVYLIGVLVFIWLVNHAIGQLLPTKAQRGIFYLFFSILAVAVFVLLFKMLKGLFVIAVPCVFLLSFLVLTRKK